MEETKEEKKLTAGSNKRTFFLVSLERKVN